MTRSDALHQLIQAIEPHKQALVEHPVYQDIDQVEDLATFTEWHVYAVWDFMSLLKALQMQLTCVELPWKPQGMPSTRRFINEIVMGEESDVDRQGAANSHYELYLDAMQGIGADTQTVSDFVNNLSTLEHINAQIESSELPDPVKGFLQFTFALIKEGKAHKIAAAFTFGREDLIPDMFTSIVRALRAKGYEGLEALIYYLERHIELDGDEHGPLSEQMIMELCADDPIQWREAKETAIEALQQRLALWDGIHQAIKAHKKHWSVG